MSQFCFIQQTLELISNRILTEEYFGILNVTTPTLFSFVNDTIIDLGLTAYFTGHSTYLTNVYWLIQRKETYLWTRKIYRERI